MKNYRRQKVASLIRDYLAQIILKEFEFPAIITLINIEIDEQFKKAKAKIKVLPTDLNLKESQIKLQELKILKELNENQNKIFKLLLKKLNLKPLPKIIFELENKI